jgi:hypothetical protein
VRPEARHVAKGRVECHAFGFQLLAERLEPAHLETDVIERAALGG